MNYETKKLILAFGSMVMWMGFSSIHLWSSLSAASNHRTQAACTGWCLLSGWTLWPSMTLFPQVVPNAQTLKKTWKNNLKSDNGLGRLWGWVGIRLFVGHASVLQAWKKVKLYCHSPSSAAEAQISDRGQVQVSCDFARTISPCCNILYEQKFVINGLPFECCLAQENGLAWYTWHIWANFNASSLNKALPIMFLSFFILGTSFADWGIA